MELAEEWYWLKVTKDGRPVTDVCFFLSQSSSGFDALSSLFRDKKDQFIPFCHCSSQKRRQSCLGIYQLDGIWRKPYETLLIARRSSLPGPSHQPHSPLIDQQMQPEIRRRVIAAVPDLHSRKPCLKSLFEEAFGFREGEYRALEVFARGLVAGWWGWGDECLRFQWEGWWWESDEMDRG